jgi:hypothetical protein
MWLRVCGSNYAAVDPVSSPPSKTDILVSCAQCKTSYMYIPPKHSLPSTPQPLPPPLFFTMYIKNNKFWHLYSANTQPYQELRAECDSYPGNTADSQPQRALIYCNLLQQIRPKSRLTATAKGLKAANLARKRTYLIPARPNPASYSFRAPHFTSPITHYITPAFNNATMGR